MSPSVPPPSGGLVSWTLVAGLLATVSGVAAPLTLATGCGSDDAAPTSSTTAPPPPTAASSAPPATSATSTSVVSDSGGCPEGMVKVPGGTFSMGSDSGDADEKPVHPVTVKTFCLDRTEVTVAAYETCVRTGKCTSAGTGDACNTGVADRKTHPINCVSWDQASAFCAAKNGRLPTEEEWEFAARGPEGRLYPWGSAPPSDQACWNGEGNDLGKGKRTGTCPVGAHTGGNTPLGLVDMAGNVWEWTAPSYCSYSKMSAPGQCDGDVRVTRGGGWMIIVASGLRGANRDGDAPSDAYGFLGFRCSREIP